MKDLTIRPEIKHAKYKTGFCNYHYTSFSGKIIVCYQPTFCSSRCASPRAKTGLIFADGDYWCVSGQHSVEAVAKIREKRRTACLDLQQWHTTCIADILKPTTPWAFRAKLAGQAQGSAQDVEPIPLYEAADNLIRCVEDQRRRGLPDTYSNLKIAIVDAVQMSALVPTAELPTWSIRMFINRCFGALRCARPRA